jgi:hypothetical protein
MHDWTSALVAGVAIVVIIWLLSRVGLAGVFIGRRMNPPPRRTYARKRTIVTAVLAIVAGIVLVWLFTTVLSR